MAMQVDGKTAIITGAGSGINFSFASLLLSKGCNVIIADLALRPESEDLLSKYSPDSAGPTAIFQKTDVTEWSQLDKLFSIATEKFGGADIVCPGAGVYEPPFSSFWYPPDSSPSVDTTSKSRYKLIDINITHPIRTTQMAVGHFMSRKKPGTVIHISSVAGQVPFFPAPIYVASKHAVQGFVRSLARLEDPPRDIPKVRVTAVAPGLIKTPLWTDHPEKLKYIPKGEQEDEAWVTPEFVAEAMLELIVSEEYPGGTILEVGKNWRKVETFNDPGPAAGINAVKNVPREVLETDMWSSLEKQCGK